MKLKNGGACSRCGGQRVPRPGHHCEPLHHLRHSCLNQPCSLPPPPRSPYRVCVSSPLVSLPSNGPLRDDWPSIPRPSGSVRARAHCDRAIKYSFVPTSDDRGKQPDHLTSTFAEQVTVYEVEWSASQWNPVTRKLVNQSHG